MNLIQLSKTSLLGSQGESVVAIMLQKQGFKLLAKNFKTLVGEVDIIAQRGKLLVFVEVKTRSNACHVFTDIVNKRKQTKTIAAAKKFILATGFNSLDYLFRFDVAFVVGKANYLEISSYIENAYGVAE